MLKEAYMVRNAEIIRVPVTKVEVYDTYFRYVCDDMSIMLNWWKPEDMEGEDAHVFYTEKDALNSKLYKQQRLAKAVKEKERAEKIIIELNNVVEFDPADYQPESVEVQGYCINGVCKKI